jgi:hypothetical protein
MKRSQILKLRVPLPKQVEKIIPDATKYNRKKEKRKIESEIPKRIPKSV